MGNELRSKWEMVRLGDVCDVRDGTHDSPKYVEKGFPLITSKNIIDGKIDFNTVNLISHRDFENINKRSKVDVGDILMPMIGTIGNSIIVDIESSFAIKNIALIKFHTNIVENKYINYILKSSVFERYVEQENRGGTQKFLSLGNIRSFELPLPPLEIQEKIAKNLDLASNLVKLHKTKLKELDKLIQSVFYDMFGDPVMNEMGWEVEKLANIGSLGRGVSKHRPRNAPELLGGDYPLIQTGEVSNSGIYITTYQNTYSEIGLKQSKMWKKGTLCITIAANIAKTAILTFDACFPDSVVGFISGERTNQIFIYTWFRFFQRILEEQAPQSAQKNINLVILSDLKVIIPPLPLQQKFAYIVAEIEKQKQDVQNALKNAEMLYDSLMQEYFE